MRGSESDEHRNRRLRLRLGVLRENLSNYPELKLVGAYDTNAENLRTFRLHWPAKAYATLEELLDAAAVEMVLTFVEDLHDRICSLRGG